MNHKNPIIAFLLAFFPGGGLLYLGKIRGGLYTIMVFGLVIIAFVSWEVFYVPPISFLFLISAVLLYIINFVDTALTGSKLIQTNRDNELGNVTSHPESERFFTIILSFVPGLGHFQLGLINRGLTLLVGFIGLSVMIAFVTALSGRSEFLVFLAFTVIIWIYGFFDAMKQLSKKQKGLEIVDQSILEEFEMNRNEGKKSKSIATFLSIFPGAGHLYLGLQRRGIQLMAAFLFSIYILDVLRLGIFLFLIPIIWFYSFFDGLQKASAYGKETLEDIPVVSYLMNHQKWVGIGLLSLGIYYLSANIIIPLVTPFLIEMMDFDIHYWFNRYFQTVIVCLLLIGGGIKLLAGKKHKGDEPK